MRTDDKEWDEDNFDREYDGDHLIEKVLEVRRHTNFGFDLHGVIDTNPKGYYDLFEDLKAEGHVIHVISGPRVFDIKTELANFKDMDDSWRLLNVIHDVHSIIDFLLRKKEKHTVKDGKYWFADVAWWSAKAQICKEYDIDYMFDDTFTYSHFFDSVKTKFIHMVWDNKPGPLDYYPD